jgi:multidrug efflux pump subunit AcrB
VPTGEFASLEDIGNLVIRPSAGDALQGGSAPSTNAELTRIRDISTIRHGYQEPPFTLMRYNGTPALCLMMCGRPLEDQGEQTLKRE